MSASDTTERTTVAGVELTTSQLVTFAIFLDRLLEEEATSPDSGISTAAYLIWRRTNRLYHLRNNDAVLRSTFLAAQEAKLAGYQFEALRKFFLGSE